MGEKVINYFKNMFLVFGQIVSYLGLIFYLNTRFLSSNGELFWRFIIFIDISQA